MIQSFRFTEYGMEKFYYEIEVFVGTHGLHESYIHIEQITDIDLNLARKKAINNYFEIEKGIIASGKFHLPYASPADFVYGENASYSMILSLVHEYGDIKVRYELAGADEASHIEAEEFENYIFQELKED
jgi:hypothetical protein